ncbi:MAG: LD-carboxypeptidase [Desulfobacteraceae bacterium IS3]|nr:MAG: LD-carboxypeptidase [Desulfobacteraceae bacterium IS3]
MMLPERLKTGDTIAFYSPSAPATCSAPRRFERAVGFLENKGFRLLGGSLTGKSDFYRSGTIKARADELNALIRNPEVRCIMSVIGGGNSNAIVPFIDYKAFEKNPKIMVGYSDITPILLAIYSQTGIGTFYGPALVSSFGEFPPFSDLTFEYFSDILIRKQPLPYSYPLPRYWTDEMINWEDKVRDKEQRANRLITVTSGIAEGRVIGGNLNSMSGIWGSVYMPEIKSGDILFLEDTSKTASMTEKLFSLLKANRVFEKISGILLGKHERFDDQRTGRSPADILKEVIGETEIPILADFDCCHTHPMLTLPLGLRIRLDATNQQVSILEPYIK